MHQRAGLGAVQTKGFAGFRHDRTDRRGGEASAQVVPVGPIAEAGALKRAAADRGEVEPADDLRAVDEGEGISLAGRRGDESAFDVLPLEALAEELLVAERLPRSEVLPVAPIGLGEHGGVARLDDPQGHIRRDASGLEHSSMLAAARPGAGKERLRHPAPCLTRPDRASPTQEISRTQDGDPGNRPASVISPASVTPPAARVGDQSSARRLG